MRDLKLEVVILPVSDVERSKRFYEGLGWRLDADFTDGKDWRALQMTPPGSPSSVIFGKGVTTVAPARPRGRSSSSTTSRRHVPSSSSTAPT